MSISFFYKHAGLVTIWGGNYGLHFFPAYSHWQWGYDKSWYDGPFYTFGIGPLFLLCWNE